MSFRAAAYDDVSLRDVAAAAGLDVGQIVREFGSKEELFEAVLAEAIEESARASSERWAQKVAEELISSGGPHTELVRLVAFSAASPKVADRVRAHVPALIAGVSRHLVPGVDLEMRASVAVAVMVGYTIGGVMLGVVPLAKGTERLFRQSLAAALEKLQSVPPSHASTTRRVAGSSETRAAILAAADAEFSELGYDHATVRGIASAAGADPALVIRYFQSKENLFLETLKLHYTGPEHLSTSGMVVDWLVWSSMYSTDRSGGSGQNILLRSTTSPVAREILKKDLSVRWHKPLAAILGGAHAEMRTALLLSVMAGVEFCRSIIRLNSLFLEKQEDMVHLRSVLQSLADPG